jgi:olefin beta-lactone synthetase
MSDANIAHRLTEYARIAPRQAAFIVRKAGKYTETSFRTLDERSSSYAAGLAAAGLKANERVVVMAPPSADFFALVFGVFKARAVLVLIDPGIERSALLTCLKEIDPVAFIGVPLAQAARLAFRKYFPNTRLTVTLDSAFGFGGLSAKSLQRLGEVNQLPPQQTLPSDWAAVLYTSGSTGVPKGAVYTHGMFNAQVEAIRSRFSIQAGEVDACTFAPFAIFNPALGVTSVLPDMGFRFPGAAEPTEILNAIAEHRCTAMFGAPALVDRLGRYCESATVTLPSLTRVLSAGAPLSFDVVRRMQATLHGNAQVYTPYGATEALPVASVSSSTLLGKTASSAPAGKGICVGTEVPLTEIKIIRISDEPIERFEAELELPIGQIGEIVVRGPVVTTQYFERPVHTALSKMSDGGSTWHRMGDVGYFDSEGRLFMCGRKSQRVETPFHTHFTVCVEEVFHRHPSVKRAALVGVGVRGRQIPVVLIEKHETSRLPDDVMLAQLQTLSSTTEATRDIRNLFVYPRAFPVDRRHNSKIVREALVQFATEAMA